MPELQGIGQVHLLSLNEDFIVDKNTGKSFFSVKILDDEIKKNIIEKSKNWIELKKKENKDKKIANNLL